MPSTIDLSVQKPHVAAVPIGTININRSFLIIPPGKASTVGASTTADMPLAQGDIYFTWVFMEDASFLVDLEPAGWNVYDTTDDGTGLSMKLLWRPVTGQDVFNRGATADGTAGYSGGGSTVDCAGYWCGVLRGVDPTNPFADGALASGASYTGALSGAAVTPTDSGAGFLDFFYCSDDGATFDVSGATEGGVNSTTAGNDGTRGWSFTLGAGTAGVPRTASFTGDQPGDKFMVYSLALNLASDAATGIHDAEVTLLDSGTAGGGGTVTMPSGSGTTTLLDTQDTVLFGAGWVDSTSNQSTPGGWTDSGQGNVGTGNEKLRSAYKRRTGSEGSITELTNHSNGGAVLWMGEVAALRNVDPYTPVVATAQNSATFSTTITLADASTTRDQSAFLVCVAIGDDSAYTIPAGWDRYVIGGGQTNQGSDGSMFWLLIPRVTAGSLSGLSLGTMSIASNNWATITYALNVAPNRRQITSAVAAGALAVDTVVEAVGGAASVVSDVQVGAAQVTTAVRRRSAPFRPRRTLVWVRNLRGVQENVIT